MLLRLTSEVGHNPTRSERHRFVDRRMAGIRKGATMDVLVGQNIRMYRFSRALSQSELGRRVGVCLQQIQKYERDTNRVSASRLTRIAAALGVPLMMLFDDGSRAVDDEQSLYALLDNRYATRLLHAFELVPHEAQRTAILRVIEVIGDAGGRRR
jgi:transcriptional regulator with XRE-family HTH domain